MRYSFINRSNAGTEVAKEAADVIIMVSHGLWIKSLPLTPEQKLNLGVSMLQMQSNIHLPSLTQCIHLQEFHFRVATPCWIASNVDNDMRELCRTITSAAL